MGMRKVMIVDDDPYLRMSYVRMLVENGFDVADGSEAVAIYKEFRPDMVLMDITMPGMDGLTALRKIKKFDPGAKVAMVTAMGQAALVMEAFKSGAVDFVIKPLNGDQVVGTIYRALRQVSPVSRN